MPDTDGERLIVLLEARIRDFEKNMQKASGTATREYGRMRGSSRSATAAMEADMMRSTSRINQMLASTSTRIGAFGKGLVGGLVAGGVAGVVSQFQQIMSSVAKVGDEARRAGVSVEAFQEWKYVAEQNRIGIDAMVDGLKELNLRADEFVQTGKGSAAEAFMRLGYGADELKKKLADPSALLLEIIDRLGKFDKAAQIRISDELFGGSAGERFVELLEQGEEGIRRTIDQAHELGVVMDKGVIERAAELDRRFNAITNTVSSGLKTAIVEAATALQAFIDSFNGMWQRYEERRQAAELGDLAGSLVGPPGTQPPPGSGTRTTPKTDRLPKAEFVPPTPPPGGFGSTSGRSSGRDKAAAEAEREAQAIRRLIGELQEELRLIGATDVEREISTALRRANVDAASKEGQQIAGLIRQIDAETSALEKNKEAQEARADAIENMFDMGADALEAVADGSMKAGDAVRKLALQLALAAAQAALFNSGPLAGLFGGGSSTGALGGVGAGIFGMIPKLFGFSEGTANTGGQRGEPRGIVHGQEAVIPLPAGGKVPVHLMGEGRNGAASRSVIELRLSPDIEARILARAGSQSVEIVRQSMPGTVQAASGYVQKQVRNRPGFFR